MTDLLDLVRTPVLVVAALVAGLQAGLYFAFAVGVMPGLAQVDDRAFVSTMQGINVAILNPLFLLTFVGAPALALLAIVGSGSAARPWVVAAAVLAVATVVVTVAGNVPLNDALAAAGEVDTIRDLAGVRGAFEHLWVRLNVVRTVTSAGALVALALAALRG